MTQRMLQNAAFILAAALIGVVLFWRVDVIHRGGPVMVPIVMGSVFSLAIIGERLYYFFAIGAERGTFLPHLRTLIESREWKEAATLCRGTPGPVARVAGAGLAAREKTATEIEEVMQEAAQEEMPQLERHHRWLSTIAQISTLLGLLGTVTGMVAAFQVIQSKATSANPVSPSDLAGGIWEALITTVAGLEVAIPTILAYNYFVSRVVDVQFQMERAAALVSNWRRSGS